MGKIPHSNQTVLQAADYLAALPIETQRARAAALVPFELQAAAQLGTLDAKIAGYRATLPPLLRPEILRARRASFSMLVTNSRPQTDRICLRPRNRKSSARASNFLGLAEIRLRLATRPARSSFAPLAAAVGNLTKISIPPRRSSKDRPQCRASNSSISS